MKYELKNAMLTIREEGFMALFQKFSHYIRDIGRAKRFAALKMSCGASPEAAVDFVLGPDAKLVAPTQIRSEILQLATLMYQRKPQTVVEIGTRMGGTLAIWCALAGPKATVVSIDLPGGAFGGGYPNWRARVYRRFAQPAQSLHLLRLDSHLPTTRDHLTTILPQGDIDFLFIDGDHSYDGVKMDFEMYTPMVRHDGLVAFHDICPNSLDTTCGVYRFWREIRTTHKNWEFVQNPNQEGYGIGVLEL